MSLYISRKSAMSSVDSRSQVTSRYTTGTSRAGVQGEDAVIRDVATFRLATHHSLLFGGLALSLSIILACGIVRSAIVLQGAITKIETYRISESYIKAIGAIEAIAEAVYNEGFARLKYLTSGLDPQYYQDVTNAVDFLDEEFARVAENIAKIDYQGQEYKSYNCSFYRIKSNLGSRPAAIPLTQWRTYDERNINPWDDGDFFECLLALLCDMIVDTVSKTSSLDYLWQGLVPYYFAIRGRLNIQVVNLYAFLTRELVLNKGSVRFVRDRDENNLADGITLAKFLLQRADLISAIDSGRSGKPTMELLDKLLDDFVNIPNATKAYSIVMKGEKFELTQFGKSLSEMLLKVLAEYRDDVWRFHWTAVAEAYDAVISESIKLGIFVVLLTPFSYVIARHMMHESKRLRDRYTNCLERYGESCNATFRLLPEPIAKKLNKGLTVKPEYFYNVTIFYSDIVGFTTICSRMSAIDVVIMLNAIYTVFDTRTSNFKCYKIETIGDAYVAASGVPNRNQDHAAEIASLALVLIEEVGMIKIPKSKTKIRIRIGINSGPVIAGVVGSKMLRYCLFGKTLIDANRLEATSKPQMIHISQQSAHELEKTGGFFISERPKSEWPGSAPTYWLRGRITNTLPLATFNSSEAHLSKLLLENGSHD